MKIDFGREICGDLNIAEQREWLVTNGLGGYAAGTIAGLLTRRYHGLLIAALASPGERMLLLAKLDETVAYGGQFYPLSTDRWQGNIVGLHGYRHIERCWLEGTMPVWQFACGEALIEKRIWMQQGANTTYIHYHLRRASQPVLLTLKAMVNYRDHHSETHANGWNMDIDVAGHGVIVSAGPEATPFYLLCRNAKIVHTHDWYYGYDLAAERSRGLGDHEDHLHAVTLQIMLHPGEAITVVASTSDQPELDGEAALRFQRAYDNRLLDRWRIEQAKKVDVAPNWFKHLVLAADQFIVNRPQPEQPNGKTIVAGYPWFSDWGRDTMISLPGLTLVTGRPEVALSILRTFAKYVDQGMLPNRFPDGGEQPDYNSADATLWYFIAIQAYYTNTIDDDLLHDLFPVLADIIDWHCRGTRHHIHLDPADGLLYVGAPGTQLTWMDAKVADWVVTPRVGKPIEINALWYNALRIMAKFARQVAKPYREYDAMAERVLARFPRFWNAATGYCYDVVDSPTGNDATLRPNQLLAVSLPDSPLTAAQQKGVVDACSRSLLTSYGLRSLDPNHNEYQGHYGGPQRQRDGAYHQGTVWGWLLGPFVTAHMRVYGDPDQAREFLQPFGNHLGNHGMGTLSEIFDGDAPHRPNGCSAQAWTVAEVLRAWFAIDQV